MLLTRCPNGHYYDKQKYNICPNCNGDVISTPPRTPNGSHLEKCENGYYYDKNKHESCPHCKSIKIDENKIYYQWINQLMDKSQITKFSITYGDLPIIHIDFDGDKLIKYNRINGSRDGWMNFPEDFFDKKSVELTDQQICSIKNLIISIDFVNWATDDYIISNIIEMPPGFCVRDSFSCEFANGEEFYCAYPPREDFNKLIEFLKNYAE